MSVDIRPERKHGESFKEYKARMRNAARDVKRRLQPRPAWDSRGAFAAQGHGAFVRPKDAVTGHSFPWQRSGKEAKAVRDRAHDERRKVSQPWRKWYGSKRWQSLRAVVLRREPICRECERAASTTVDHIIAHNGDAALFFTLSNLRGMCKKCHDRKTVVVDGGFGNASLSYGEKKNVETEIGGGGA